MHIFTTFAVQCCVLHCKIYFLTFYTQIYGSSISSILHFHFELDLCAPNIVSFAILMWFQLKARDCMWTLLVGEFSFQTSAAKFFLSPFLLWIILPTAHCRVYHTQIPDSRRHEFGFGGVACVSDSGPIREEGSCQDMSNQLYRHCGICLKIASRSWCCLHWIFNFWYNNPTETTR